MTRKARHQLQQKSFKNLMFETNLMREESFLTDFQLKCEDKEFWVHKVILSAASPYFKEHFKRNSQTSSLQMDFINSKTLDTVLMYIYQGRIELKNQSQPFLKDLLEAFIIFKIPLMYNYCLEHLLGTQQLLSQWNTIEQLNSELIQQIYLEYLLKNIKTLKTTESFLNLRFEQLNTLLNCSVSNPVNQEELISCILLWKKRDESTRLNRINDLLATIDFEKLSKSSLLNLSEEPLLQDNLFFHKQCTKVLFSELKKNREDEGFKSILKQIRIKKKTKLNISDKEERILVYGLWFSKKLFEFNPEIETLTEVKDEILLNFFSSRADSSTVCSFDNFIYCFGGEDNEGNPINKCFMLDLLENQSMEIKSMSEPLKHPFTVKLHQFIYVIKWNSCERFNLLTKSWEPMAEMLPNEYFDLFDPLLAIDGRLCLIGMTHLHWYDPQTNQWSQGDPVPDKFQKEDNISATYFNGKIFVVAYVSGDVYCFDLMMKTWTTFSSPDHSLMFCTSISCIKKSDSVEFLILGQREFCIFRPPNIWKQISRVPILSCPCAISIGGNLMK